MPSNPRSSSLQIELPNQVFLFAGRGKEREATLFPSTPRYSELTWEQIETMKPIVPRLQEKVALMKQKNEIIQERLALIEYKNEKLRERLTLVEHKTGQLLERFILIDRVRKQHQLLLLADALIEVYCINFYRNDTSHENIFNHIEAQNIVISKGAAADWSLLDEDLLAATFVYDERAEINWYKHLPNLKHNLPAEMSAMCEHLKVLKGGYLLINI